MATNNSKDIFDVLLFDLPYALIKKLMNSSPKDSKVFNFDDLNSPIKRTNPFGRYYSYVDACDKDFRIFDFARHTLLCGKTGSGKNECSDQLMDYSLSCGTPMVFIDGKGDIESMQRFIALNKKHGRKYYVFSELLADSDKCNPVLEGDATTIMDRISSAYDFDNPFYKDENKNALLGSIIKLKNDNQTISLANILSYIKLYFDTDETKDIQNKLSLVVNSSFGEILSGGSDAVTFSKIRNEGASIYIGLSTLGFPEAARAIANMFIYELMYHTYKTFSEFAVTKKTKVPFQVFLDEFGALGTRHIVNLANKARGAKIGLVFMFQHLSDLLEIAGKGFTNQIVGAVDNFIIGHTSVPDEASFWANVVGTRYSEAYTTVIEGGEETDTGSKREGQEFLIHPSTFKILNIGQFALFNVFPNMKADVVKLHQVKSNYSDVQLNIKIDKVEKMPLIVNLSPQKKTRKRTTKADSGKTGLQNLATSKPEEKTEVGNLGCKATPVEQLQSNVTQDDISEAFREIIGNEKREVVKENKFRFSLKG